MSPETFDTAEQELRHAVIYRRFGEVDARLRAFCNAGDCQLRELEAGEPRHQALLLHILDVLEWTRLMLSAARASCSARLERAETMDRYLGTQIPEPRPTARFEF